MVPKTWPWYATSPSIWSAKSLTSDRSSAAESAPPGTRNTCWKSSARCGRNLVNLDSLPSPHMPLHLVRTRKMFGGPRAQFVDRLSLTLANSEQAHRPRGMRNIGSLSTISSALEHEFHAAKVSEGGPSPLDV